MIGWAIVLFVVSPLIKYAFSSMHDVGLFKVSSFFFA
jgi:predicted secreted protein